MVILSLYLKFLSFYARVLLIFLTLEIIVLLNLFFFFSGLNNGYGRTMMVLRFLVITVCEASVGLCLLVNVGRNMGLRLSY